MKFHWQVFGDSGHYRSYTLYLGPYDLGCVYGGPGSDVAAWRATEFGSAELEKRIVGDFSTLAKACEALIVKVEGLIGAAAPFPDGVVE
jgi:hypothetical protein